MAQGGESYSQHQQGRLSAARPMAAPADALVDILFISFMQQSNAGEAWPRPYGCCSSSHSCRGGAMPRPFRFWLQAMSASTKRPFR